MKNLLYILLCTFSLQLVSQTDSVLVTELAPFNDGLYLTHSDHRHNKPIPKQDIVTKINKDQVDFFYKVTSEKTLEYLANGASLTIDPKTIWGFVQNHVLFINYKGVFYRVPVFGSISYFVGVIEVTGYYTGVYDPMYGMGGGRAIKTKELSEFILNYYEGKVYPFEMDLLDKLLSTDEVVYKEFKSLSRRKRQKQVTRFIRMYNDRHPVHYLK